MFAEDIIYPFDTVAGRRYLASRAEQYPSNPRHLASRTEQYPNNPCRRSKAKTLVDKSKTVLRRTYQRLCHCVTSLTNPHDFAVQHVFKDSAPIRTNSVASSVTLVEDCLTPPEKDGTNRKAEEEVNADLKRAQNDLKNLGMTFCTTENDAKELVGLVFGTIYLKIGGFFDELTLLFRSIDAAETSLSKILFCQPTTLAAVHDIVWVLDKALRDLQGLLRYIYRQMKDGIQREKLMQLRKEVVEALSDIGQPMQECRVELRAAVLECKRENDEYGKLEEV